MNKVAILKLLQKGNNTIFDRDVDDTIRYVNSFKPPKDLWQRSYYQFKCQRYDVPAWKRLAYSVGALFLLPFSLVYFRLSHIRVRFIQNEDCVCDCFDIVPMIPDSLSKEYNINCDAFFSGYGLSKEDVFYIFKHASYLFLAPSFYLHIIFKIARYSNIIHKYAPRAFVCHSEYSYSSSVLTDYCRRKNIIHINIMHGERLLNIRIAFCEFDKCYVWHEHYMNIFLQLRTGMQPSQFVIELPPALRINVKELFDKSAYSDYKYYLGNQSSEEIVKINEMLTSIRKKGYNVRIRPHPRYTNINEITRLLSSDDIELPSTVDVMTSVASCKYVVGCNSTVLLQAFLCNQVVLIDDITYPKRVDTLKKAQYILLSVEGPSLLSKHFLSL